MPFCSPHAAAILETQDDDGAEMFDVGTAVANPYVCLGAWRRRR